MGRGSYDPDAFKTYSTSRATMSTSAIFTSAKITDYLDPKNITIRESRDSAVNPLSTAIILAVDVTGSMGELAAIIARKGLGVTFEEILKRIPVTDPQVMVMGIGDIRSDNSPLQLTQFEVEVPPMTEQLEKLYLEGGGGGNKTESYDLAWYSAAMLTSIDCFEKRGKKGYLFTIGDEEAPKSIPAGLLRDKTGLLTQSDIPSEDSLEMASRKYEVFHIIVQGGSHVRNYGYDSVIKTWTPLLGQRVIPLSDVNDLAEVIVSTIEVNEGKDLDSVVSSWSGSTAVTVKNAIKDLVPGAGTSGSDAVVRF